MEGTLHIYQASRRLPLFAYAHPSDRTSSPAPNILLFIGGMYDNFLSTGYVADLATLLAKSPTYRLIHLQLSSCGRQFGTSSLDKDVSEMAAGIKFIRSTPAFGTADSKVVLMGHSTGCQDVLHYITAGDLSSRPAVHGAILQAPVSDRDSLLNFINTDPSAKSNYDACMELINKTPSADHRTTLPPFKSTTALFGPVPMSIERFLSLASPTSPSNPGPDDKFSSDATPSALSQTFGSLGGPNSPLQPTRDSKDRSLLVLISGSDETMSSTVDKPYLLSKWQTALSTSGTATLHPDSGIISDGLHDLSGDSVEARRARLLEMRVRVLRYMSTTVEDVGDECWNAWQKDKIAINRELEKQKRLERGETRNERGVEEGVGAMKL